MPEENGPGSPDDTKPSLSVVLPAYQEEENLRILLPRILSTLATLEVPSEVIVIGVEPPVDATETVCESLGVRYMARTGGPSFGDAVRTGIRACRGDYVIFMDADGSHPPEMLPALYNHRTIADVVVASRYVEHGFTENTRVLIAMSRVLNWTYRVFLGIAIHDCSNSFRLYRSTLIKNIPLACTNFDIVQEILIKITKSAPGAKIIEIPTTFKKRLFGKTKRNLPIFIAGYVFTMIKLKLNKNN